MGDIYAPSAFEVSDGTGHIQYAVEGPGRKVKPLGGRLQKALGAIVQLAILPDFGWAHLGVTKEAAFLEPRPLNFSVLCYPQSGTARILGLLVFNQLFVLHRRNFHEHIDQSSSGPLMRFWYRVTVDGEQLHSLVG